MSETHFIAALDVLADQGEHVKLWLRDDDCIEPSAALDTFLALTTPQAIPATLAVIPASTGEALARRLTSEPHVSVAVHGWSHANHAPPGVKKRELGLDRPIDVIAAELRQGHDILARLHEERFVSMLVPPWNRIDPAIVALLPDLGYRALSTFGPERPAAVPMLNTHVDVIDWRGTRGGRDAAILFAETAALCLPGGVIGILTHHLVHDAAVNDFLGRLFRLSAGHPGCRWMSSADLLACSCPSPAFPGDQKP